MYPLRGRGSGTGRLFLRLVPRGGYLKRCTRQFIVVDFSGDVDSAVASHVEPHDQRHKSHLLLLFRTWLVHRLSNGRCYQSSELTAAFEFDIIDLT
jgi:hypothetical protein